MINEQERRFTLDEVFLRAPVRPEYLDDSLPFDMQVEYIERLDPTRNDGAILHLRDGRRMSAAQWLLMYQARAEGGVVPPTFHPSSPEADMTPLEAICIERAMQDQAVPEAAVEVTRCAVALRIKRTGLTAREANAQAGKLRGWPAVGAFQHERGGPESHTKRAGRVFNAALAMLTERQG